MDVLAGRKEIGVEDATKKVTVASNCWARLLYYLYCVNSCLKDDGEDLIPRNLTDYARYYALSDDDKITILTICAGLLNVKNLIGKIFFPVDKVDGGYNGKFYKITETTELVALGIRADRVVGIGGSSKEVTTIMLITEGWVDTNFIKPVKEATQSLQRQTYVAPRVTYSSYQSPSPSYKPSPSPSPSYYTPSSSKKGCLAGKFKHILLFIVGLVILGYVSYEIAPVYFDQKDALDASNYNSWPLNTYSALITLSGEEVAYIKVYFDSNGVNQAANALSVSTTSPNQVDVSYARGRYSWWDRQYDPPQFLGATDLLSEDSFVYFRFQLSGTSLTTSFNATFIGAHSYSGSTDWTTIQWMQQTWFYGLFSLGALLVVIPGGLIVFSCLRRRQTFPFFFVSLLLFFGSFLVDLTFMADGNPGMIGRRVNFIKYKYMYSVISTIQAYQTEPYNLEPVISIQDFFRSRPIQDEGAVFDLSLAIEPRGAERADIQ